MPSTSRVRVFVDANVLASPVPRTILYLAQPLSSYELAYSPRVEQEAECHQKPDHVPVSTLRHRWDWTTVPDAAGDDLADTDPKDKPILAAAIAAGASFVVTGNVRDFGAADLEAHDITAVHPGLFLAHHLTAETYREVSSKRSARRAPVSPATRCRSTNGRSPCTCRRCSSGSGPCSGRHRPTRRTSRRRCRSVAHCACIALAVCMARKRSRSACATTAGSDLGVQ